MNAQRVLGRAAFLGKYVIVGVFLLSAIGKMQAPGEFISFLTSIPGIDESGARISLYLLVIIELGVVLLLLIPRTSWNGLLAGGSLLLVFTVVLIVQSQFGTVESCGCFGEILPEGSIDSSILRNIGLLVLTIFVIGNYEPPHAAEKGE